MGVGSWDHIDNYVLDLTVWGGGIVVPAMHNAAWEEGGWLRNQCSRHGWAIALLCSNGERLGSRPLTELPFRQWPNAEETLASALETFAAE